MLAGGAGARLGAGRPKALVELAGATLLDRAVATLAEACEEVVVAAPAGLALPGCPVPRVDDPPGAAGPLAGIVAAARARPGLEAIVLGVDFPLVRSAWLRELRTQLGAYEAVIPAHAGRAQPLVAIYTAAALARLVVRFDEGERAVTRATAALDAARPDEGRPAFPGADSPTLLNVNTPADLAAAARALEPGSPG